MSERGCDEWLIAKSWGGDEILLPYGAIPPLINGFHSLPYEA